MCIRDSRAWSAERGGARQSPCPQKADPDPLEGRPIHRGRRGHPAAALLGSKAEIRPIKA
eukprot:5395797-Alexandrium_andersonii.AAC.1